MLDAGVNYIFGVPGTTEIALMDAFAAQEDLQFVLTLHESVAVAMADGLARATGTPAVVSVHATVGTANTLGMLIYQVVLASIKQFRYRPRFKKGFGLFPKPGGRPGFCRDT